MEKSLDQKLRDIHRDPSGSREFIIADAKDADMAFGIGAPGQSLERHDGEVRFKTLAEYRQQIREVIRQGIVDIVLMSASTSELLTLEERLFEDSPVTPAVRANDATDVHAMRRQPRFPRRPRGRFARWLWIMPNAGIWIVLPKNAGGASISGCTRSRSTTIANWTAKRSKPTTGFARKPSARAFGIFWKCSIRTVPMRFRKSSGPAFINDVIARTLAGVGKSGRPIFLKIAYQGPEAMEALVGYDPHLIVGVLGRSRRHDARCVSSAVRGPKARGEGGVVRAEDQSSRVPVGVY